ncbi:MAG: hypothetical protein M3Q65_10895 [Chloroflexota bacterium]|nr:hypothetical protein [Chloroflexota bacterium]
MRPEDGAGAGGGDRISPGPAEGAFEGALALLERERAVERIWGRDASLWSDDPGVGAKIGDRLGWLTVTERMRGEAEDLAVFGREIRDAGFERAVVLGMGGSSLCVEVVRQAFGSADGFPRLTVLDTTDPATIRALESELDLARTLFIVASKSGGTLETLSHAAYFFERVTQTRDQGDGAGSQFIAITDPGSKLAALAEERGYRRVFLNPPDIGGRYSVLSYFGLVPAALAGVDLARLLDRALGMMAACRRPARENPGARLGALIGGAAREGRDKLTIVTPGGLRAFGDWAEQLIAESTGKEGRGIVPVTGEALGEPGVYRDDRVFVHLYLRDPESRQDLALDRLPALDGPVARLDLEEVYDLGAEFFRWEFATAVAGKILGINPFDEPNVQESKDNTSRFLAIAAESGQLPEPEPIATTDGLALVWPGNPTAGDFDAAFAAFLAGVKEGDYLALQAYFAPLPEYERPLQALRHALRDRLRVATTLGYGPRFLHSTGQLHKGGANNGVFLQLVAPAAGGPPLPIPGQDYGFDRLIAAQALGDLRSLVDHGRRVARVDLGDDIVAGLRALQGALERAAGQAMSG